MRCDVVSLGGIVPDVSKELSIHEHHFESFRSRSFTLKML